MRTYLVYFSYIGTFYRGLASSYTVGCNQDLFSIEGVLQNAIQKYFCEDKILLHTSSRTDKGVHAFVNTLLFKAPSDKDEVTYDPENITKNINMYLKSTNQSIIIQKIIPVPAYFHCRKYIKSRTYLYRLGVIQDKKSTGMSSIDFHLPLMEKNRCYFVSQPFCEETFKKCGEVLSGLHDYETFMCKTSEEKITTRNVQIQIEKGCGLFNFDHTSYSDVIFYDVIIKSRSFLYKQIRKMVGAMVSTARNKIALSDVEWMLAHPSIYNWNHRAQVLPPDGLYLKSIEYNSLFKDSIKS